MAKYSQIFWRVIRSYSIEEKSISVILVLLIAGGLVSAGVNLFKSPELFWGESGIYSEGAVSERAVVLNPLYVDFSEAGRDVSALIFSGLTKYDPDLKAFVGDMADMTISKDKKTYHFTLKNGLFWHDGEPVTSDDVYFTFHDIIQSPDFQNPVLKANFEGVTINRIDERNIEFVLQKPNSFFITNLNVGILPLHALDGIDAFDLPYDSFNVKPIGSGPYKVDTPMEVLEDGRQRIMLTVSNNYYGEHPNIKSIRFNIYPDAKSLAKEKNILNVIAKVPQEISAEITESGRFTLTPYQLPQYSAIFFNMDSKVLKKDKVRLALLKSFDKAELMKLLPGKVTVDTPLMELSQADWSNKINLDDAKGALYDSGYKIVKDSGDIYRKDGDGNVLKIGIMVRKYADGSGPAAEVSTVVEFFRKAWEAAGVQLEVQYEEADIFNERLLTRDYDMVLTGQSMGYNYDTYSYWHSSQAGEIGLNLSNFRSFAADSLIEKIRDTFDPEMKMNMMKDLAKEISQDVPAIFLFRPSYSLASDGKVKGIDLDYLAFTADRFAHIDRWCINCR